MASADLRRTPERMTIANIASGDVLTAQFNPAELGEKLGANYARLAIVGLSHKPHQYQQTDNHGFDFDLGFRVFDNEGNKLTQITFARKFLLSMLYPRRGAGDIVGGAPPRALFVWPNLVSLTAVIVNLEFKHTLFGNDGQPYHFGCKVTLEATSDVRIFSEDVLASGTQRSGST